MATIEVREGATGKRYRVRVRILGERDRTKTFTRKTDAEAWGKATETDLSRGVYVPTGDDRRRTVADLIDKTIAEHLPTKANGKSAHSVARQLQWWRTELGTLTLDKLTPGRIAEARLTLRKRRTRTGTCITPATVNRFLAALSVATKWAWKELRWLRSNPVLEVTKGPESAGVIRFLSDDERKALLDAARADLDPNIYAAIVLALCTGLRAGNLRSLTWADVDFDRAAICVRETKNGDGRWVPLVGPAYKVLKSHHDRDPTGEGWVFKSATRDVPAAISAAPWQRVRAAAGLVGPKSLRFHDLRHTAATYMHESGASTVAIAAALGHRTLVMAKRYAHQSDRFTREVLAKAAERITE